MHETPPPVTAVVLARNPVAGAAKTRLVEAGLLDPVGAAALAAAMLRCTVQRLAGGPLVVAVTPDGSGDAVRAAIGAPVETVDQGPGDLGQRLDRVWASLEGGPVAVFGADAPDVPRAMLRAVAAGAHEADVAVGPTEDGGYWTLAARRRHGALFRQIDWGSDRVYDQTCARAREAGLRLHVLPAWRDVDRPADVIALRRRLAKLPLDHRPQDGPDAEPLRVLRRRLDELLDDGGAPL